MLERSWVDATPSPPRSSENDVLDAFNVNQRITTNLPAEQVLQLVAEMAQADAKKVQHRGGRVTIEYLGARSSNDNHRDITTVTARSGTGGMTLHAQGRLAMAPKAWFMVLLLLLLFPFSLLLLFIILPAKNRQGQRCRDELQTLLSGVDEELRARAAHSQPIHGHAIHGHAIHSPMGQASPIHAVGQAMPSTHVIPALAPTPMHPPSPPTESPMSASRPVMASTSSTSSASSMPAAPNADAKTSRRRAPEAFYIKRGGKVIGPVSRSKLSQWRKDKKFSAQDQVAVTPSGPWFEVVKVHRRIIDKRQGLPS